MNQKLLDALTHLPAVRDPHDVRSREAINGHPAVALASSTGVGKIFKPALVDRELLSVLVDESLRADAPLTLCEVVRDPGSGPIVRWRAERNAEALAERLGRYTFRTERA